MSFVRKGIRCIGVAVILAAIAGISLAEAGTFFAETPKHAPRLGRRSSHFPQVAPMKKAQRMKYFYAEIPKAMPRIGRRSEPVLQLASPWKERGDNVLCRDRHMTFSATQNYDQKRARCWTLQDLLRLSAFRDSNISQNLEDSSTDDDYDIWYDKDLDKSRILPTKGPQFPYIGDLLQRNDG